MAVSTVSTYAVVQSVLGDVSTVENNLNQEQQQLASGNQYQNFSSMAGQTEQYLSLSDTINQTDQYLTDHQTIEANVNTTSSVLTQIVTIANNLQTLISGRLTGVANQGVSNQITSLWQELSGQLNTHINGQYLFSGSAANTPPISDAFPTLQQAGVPDLGYFQANTQALTTRVDSNTVISYNVTAGDPAFQDIFAGLAMARAGDENNNTEDLNQAESLVASGIQGISALQATVGSTAQQLATSDTNLNNEKLYYQGLQQTIGNTDIVSVSTQVAVNQGILQAAFEAFAKISSLQLSNYLK